MPYVVTEFESTPNPNAVKCWLDRPISRKPESYLNADQARADVLASALFNEAGVTNILFNGQWMTIGKAADASWPAIKARVKKVLAGAADRLGGEAMHDATTNVAAAKSPSAAMNDVAAGSPGAARAGTTGAGS